MSFLWVNGWPNFFFSKRRDGSARCDDVAIDLNICESPWPVRCHILRGQGSQPTNNITESNILSLDVVKWSALEWAPQGQVSGIQNVSLAAASVNLFIIPLEMPNRLQ